MKKLLAPSVLSADFSNLSQGIRLVELGGADLIHCDIMDGHFVPNLTFGPLIVDAVKRTTKLPLDVHLMIKNPDNFLSDFKKAGAEYLTVHQEEVVHLHRTVAKIKDLGMKPGVSLNPGTPVSTLSEILPFVDLVLIMSVNPGFGGQKFIPHTMSKVRELVELREMFEYKYLIEVDGGINKKTISSALNAGCDIFVAGSSIFSSDNVTGAALELKNIITQSEEN
jgi:ribulose-phosphate 3-epimerase